MRGARSFSRGGRVSSYRGSSNSHYHGSSSYGGYDNSHSNGGRYRGGGSGYSGRESYEPSFESRNSSGRYEGHSNSHRYPAERSSDFHKRQFHQSSRDRSVDRKRPRYSEGSRRSLEYGGNSSSDYGSNRYSESSSYRRPYEPSSRSAERPATFRPREVPSQRSRERMAPPKSLPPRRPRGATTYRGRNSILRGVRRPPPTTQTAVLRRKYLSLKSRTETARRVKIARLRSTLLKKNSTADKKSIEPEDEDSKVDKVAGDGEAETNPETPTKKSTKPSVKPADANEVGTDASAKDESDADENNDEEKKSEADSKPKAGYKSPQKSYIKLVCVHCNIKCVTFKEYQHHLYGRQHKLSLKRLSLRQKAQLARMRLAQRNNQREIEESAKDTDELNSQFCLLCRLNYRSEKSEHQASEAHRKMKAFLMPYCTYCRIGFKSPMEFETHNCTIDHIKRKARHGNESTAASENECEVDLEQFMTVDSIGDVDDHNENDEEQSERKDENSATDGRKPKADINVGNEHVKKVEVYYCELCRFYLPLNDDQATALSKHCCSRSHLRAYLRYKENEDLRLAAEKIHRRHQQEREAKKEKAAAKTAAKAEVKQEGSDSIKVKRDDEIDDSVEDKIWADVDKDLGELLQEVGNIEENDNEDEDSTATERYDRFKNSVGDLETGGKVDGEETQKTENDASEVV
ncbi:Cip1-interacting zinc finger protein, partial [Pseudolycoriella hygida]